MTAKQYKKKLWPIVSEYIRRRDSVSGVAACCTCGAKSPWKKMHAGHFIPAAQGNSTRWDERNIHAQCFRCNMNLGGNGAEYYPFMVEKYGQEVVDELRALSNTIAKFTKDDWQKLIDDYTEKLDGVRSKD